MKNPYKNPEKRWQWFLQQADSASNPKDRACFWERAWREAEGNADFYARRNNRRAEQQWRSRATQAAEWQILAEGRFAAPCTCRPLFLPDRVLVSGEDDCPIHGFGSIEEEGNV